MSDYRKALKEHFESIPAFNSMLKVNYIFYGLGLLFLILASIISISSVTASDLFNAWARCSCSLACSSASSAGMIWESSSP